MNNSVLNGLQLYRTKWFSDLVDENMLSNALLTRPYEITATDTPGINQTPIKLFLKEKWFGPGSILAFDDREFQVRVSGEPYQDGDLWVYTVYVADGQASSYIYPSL